MKNLHRHLLHHKTDKGIILKNSNVKFVQYIVYLILFGFIGCNDTDMKSKLLNSKTEKIEIRNQSNDSSIDLFTSIKDEREILSLKDLIINLKETNERYNTKGNYGAIDIRLIDINDKVVTVRCIITDQGYVIKNGKNLFVGDSVYYYIKDKY